MGKNFRYHTVARVIGLDIDDEDDTVLLNVIDDLGNELHVWFDVDTLDTLLATGVAAFTPKGTLH